MKRFVEVSSYGDAARILAAFTVIAVIVSLGISECVARLIGQPTDWKHYLFSIGMPLVITPMAVIPLVGMNLRLTLLRVEMHKLARTDVLTGLMNRRAFFEHGAQALAANSFGVAVMMIDVDKFKTFNDTHGHDAGDAVLAMISSTISAETAASATGGEISLARIGGEEFALLATHMSAERAEKLAGAICAVVRASPCHYRGRDLHATVSIGLALGTGPEKIEQLLKAADTAVYEAKHAGRDRFCVAALPIMTSDRGTSQVLRAHSRAA
jgi:diguanylate cyclase (GGDEF)-like protein